MIKNNNKDVDNIEHQRQHIHKLAHHSKQNTLVELTSGIAHELNQPLAAISNYARGCVRRINANNISMDELLKVCERIAAQAERAGAVLLRMRNLISKGCINFAQHDITEIINDAINYLEFDLENAATQPNIEILIPNNIPKVWVDKIQIEQIIINIIQNALDAMQNFREQKITISCSLINNQWLKVDIKDVGGGLPDHSLQKIFSPFFTTKKEGMGIGLAICLTIIQAHGGELQVENNNQGATFSFTLPTQKELIDGSESLCGR